jgi:hypothetical protein
VTHHDTDPAQAGSVPVSAVERYAHHDPDVDWHYGADRPAAEAVMEALDRLREVSASMDAATAHERRRVLSIIVAVAAENTSHAPYVLGVVDEMLARIVHLIGGDE